MTDKPDINAEILDRLFDVVESRKGGDADASYTAKLLAAGTPKIAQKVGEEAVETVIEALADGGVRMGLTRDVALRLAAQTVLGAARMVLDSGQHPAVLKDQIASPGGTTIAALHKLEEKGLRDALISAVQAATERAEELGSS